MPSRTATMASDTTYSSRAPLTAAAADMGYGRAASPAPRLPGIDPSIFPPRPGTSNSQRTMASRPGTRGPVAGSDYAQSSLTESLNATNLGRGVSTASRPMNNYNRHVAQDSYSSSKAPTRQYNAYNPGAHSGSGPYAESSWESAYEPPQPSGMNRQQYPPSRSATAPIPPRGPQYPPQRNLTAPSDYFDRPAPSSHAPSQSQQGSFYDYDVEGQRNRMY
jgi:hypothetical protein